MSSRRLQQPRRTTRLAAMIEALERRQLLTSFTVTNTANAGAGSLRQAILDANANAGFDQIQFNISPGGPVTIAPTSQLPAITDTANLDGTNLFPGAFFERRVFLSGVNAPSASGLVLTAGLSGVNRPVVRNLQVANWSAGGGNGLLIDGSTLASVVNVDGGSTVASGNNNVSIRVRNSSGTSVSNCEAFGNGLAGFAIENSSNTSIDSCTASGNPEGISVFGGSTGSVISASTIISNTGAGVKFSGSSTSGNSIISSVIGYTGTSAAAPNNVGVLIDDGADNNVIGGPTVADRNFIAGNSGANVKMDSATGPASGNVVQGNFIGLTASGSAVTGAPSAAGVLLAGFAGGNFIGQPGGTPNVISGNNGRGISVNSNNNTINNNRIGTNEAGTSGIGNNADGIFIGTAFNNVLRNCLTSGNAGHGIQINNAGQNLITGCLIGTNAAGTSNLGNGLDGVSINVASVGNVVGGDTAAERNVISGNNGYGVRLFQALTQNNVVKGNYIGTNAAGTANIGNGFDGVGIRQDAQFNTIGPNNVISGNNFKGVIINETASNNLITGNFIGTNAAGTGTIPNATEGILIDAACEDNRITGNVIGGNFADNVKNSGDFTQINNNYIGTTIGGVALGGVQGINQFGSDGTISGNILSGNSQHGLVIDGGDRNVVNGNYIGTTPNGTAALANASDGVALINGAQDNVIGGFNSADRNVISANGFDGIVLADAGTRFNAIRGNYIGTDVTGLFDLGNADEGVSIRGGATNNTIGGSDVGTRNIISGNNSAGVAIVENGTNSNNVSGNYIGTDATGLLPMPNLAGVFIGNGGPQNNTVGGESSFAQRNLIAFNTMQGVRVDEGGTNSVRGNSISNNGGLGIERGSFFPLNPPVLTSATSAGGSTNVQGSITGEPFQTYVIDVFSTPMAEPGGGIEGAIYLGWTVVSDNGPGVANFSVNLNMPAALVTATATILDIVNYGTTSNFSNAVGQTIGTGNVGAGLAVVPTATTAATLGVLAGANLTFNANPALTVAQDTSINVNPAALPVTTALSLNVSATLDVLTIKSRGTVTVANNALNYTPRIKQLVTQDDGRLDLTDNAFILDYDGSSPIANVRSLLASGYASGAWNGPGITSSTAAANSTTAIGYGERTTLFATFPTTFLGETADSTSILFRYTLAGDANLDRTVNANDFSILATNFGNSNRSFSQGDFNYDGIVNANDFSILATRFGTSLAPAGQSSIFKGSGKISSTDEDALISVLR